MTGVCVLAIIKTHRMASSVAFLASGRNGFYNQQMILSCPSCHARYLISANLFSAGPRQVRCARCTHSWEAELPPELDAVGPSPDSNLTMPPEVTPPIPAGSNLPAIRKKPLPPGLLRKLAIGAMMVALAAFLIVGVLERRLITQKWPSTDTIYDAIGLHIYHYGEGLSFVGVRSELRYDDGKMVLAVEGKVHNSSPNPQDIPNIAAAAMEMDSKTVQSWQIAAPAIRVASGEDVEFHSSIDAPKEAVAEINLSFVETKHDNDQ
jgi:predicted Zn finger-like uncharacterized protein